MKSEFDLVFEQLVTAKQKVGDIINKVSEIGGADFLEHLMPLIWIFTIQKTSFWNFKLNIFLDFSLSKNIEFTNCSAEWNWFFSNIY